MGVPTFLRYLHDRFPRCIRDFVEPSPGAAPSDGAVRIDHLYLDFNGLVHSATHPSDRAAPANDAARLGAVLEQLDRVVLAARPRRLLFIALDGVARGRR